MSLLCQISCFVLLDFLRIQNLRFSDFSVKIHVQTPLSSSHRRFLWVTNLPHLSRLIRSAGPSGPKEHSAETAEFVQSLAKFARTKITETGFLIQEARTSRKRTTCFVCKNVPVTLSFCDDKVTVPSCDSNFVVHKKKEKRCCEVSVHGVQRNFLFFIVRVCRPESLELGDFTS